MASIDYDNPDVEERWCAERRQEVADYLKTQGVTHGRIGEWPAWHIAPYVSIWAIESLKVPESIGWWVICGDLPTDYVSAADIKHPRDVMRTVSERWTDVADHMSRGEDHPEITIGTNENRQELAPLLNGRAELLAKFAEDDSLWES